MTVKGIKIAPEGAKCSCCWTDLTQEDREGGSSYATVEVHSTSLGESQSITFYLCRNCARWAALSANTKIGTQILSDSVESGVRTLARLRGEIT